MTERYAAGDTMINSQVITLKSAIISVINWILILYRQVYVSSDGLSTKLYYLCLARHTIAETIIDLCCTSAHKLITAYPRYIVSPVEKPLRKKKNTPSESMLFGRIYALLKKLMLSAW